MEALGHPGRRFLINQRRPIIDGLPAVKLTRVLTWLIVIFFKVAVIRPRSFSKVTVGTPLKTTGVVVR